MRDLLEDERESLKSSPKLAELTKRLSELEGPTNHQKELLVSIQTEFGAEAAT